MSRILDTESLSKRIYGLDILRAFAILFVVYGHGAPLVPKDMLGIYNIFNFDGVAIFFVLSGFLIGGILLKEINKNDKFTFKNLRHFWIRRWFRTLPNYFLVLTFLVVLGSFYNAIPNFLDTIKYYFFLQNLYNPHPRFFAEAWSLSIEEWFYILVPLLLYFSLKWNKISKQRVVLLIICIVIAASILVRIINANMYDGSLPSNWDSIVLLRLDSIMFGFLSAYIKYYYSDKWIRNKNFQFVCGVLILLYIKIYPYFFDSAFVSTYLLHILKSIGTYLLLPKLFSIKSGSGFLFNFFTLISIISYSMYLLNLSPIEYNILPRVMNRIPGNSIFIEYVLYWILTIGLSYFLYRFYEKPMTNLRDKFAKNKKL